MIKQRPAYEEVTIAFGECSVTLRPTLRAASILEQRYGVHALFKAVQDGNYTILSDIIRMASYGEGGHSFLAKHDGKPLFQFLAVVQVPILKLLLMFQPEQGGQDSTASQYTQGNLHSWSDFFGDLFQLATGWLGWTPDQAWNATPNEIIRAHAGYIKKHEAIYGTSNQGNSHNPKDEEFDREGLHALKGDIAREL